MNTNEKGDIGLVKSMSDIVEKGYFVFMPLSDTKCVDLVISNSKMELRRAQIKYCSISDGKMELRTSTVVNGKRVPVDLNKVDVWIVYCPDNGSVYYLPIEEMKGKKSINLRVDEPIKKNKNIKMAKDYMNLKIVFEK